MTGVLCVLAILSVFAGLINWPKLWGGKAWLHHFLSSVVSQAPEQLNPAAFQSSIKLAVFSSVLGAAGLALAWFRYRNFDGKDFRAPGFNLLKNKFYVDEIYDYVIVRNLRRMGEFLWKVVDQGILDGTLDGLARIVRLMGERIRSFQSGMAQSYVMWMWLGVLVLIASAWTVR